MSFLQVFFAGALCFVIGLTVGSVLTHQRCAKLKPTPTLLTPETNLQRT